MRLALDWTGNHDINRIHRWRHQSVKKIQAPRQTGVYVGSILSGSGKPGLLDFGLSKYDETDPGPC